MENKVRIPNENFNFRYSISNSHVRYVDIQIKPQIKTEIEKSALECSNHLKLQ